MKKRRLLLRMFAAALVVSILTACSGSSSSSTASSAASQAESATSSAETSTAASSAASAVSDGTESVDKSRTITTKDGYVVENLPEEPQRIAALFGPSYERVYMLGAEDKTFMTMAGITNAWGNLVYKRINADDMIQLESPNTNLNVEDLVAENIDLVFYWDVPETLEAINNVGIAAVPYLSEDTIYSVRDEIEVYSEAINTEEAKEIFKKYDEYYTKTIEDISAISETIPEDEKKTVYYAWRDVYAPATAQYDIDAIRIAGGIPVTDEAASSSGNGAEYDTIDKEQLVAWDPDFIFLDHSSKGKQLLNDELYADEDLANLKAVQNKTAYVLPCGVRYWDSGAQFPLLLKYLAVTINPEYYPDINMAEEVKNFYSEFFNYELTDEQVQHLLDGEDP